MVKILDFSAYCKCLWCGYPSKSESAWSGAQLSIWRVVHKAQAQNILFHFSETIMEVDGFSQILTAKSVVSVVTQNIPPPHTSSLVSITRRVRTLTVLRASNVPLGAIQVTRQERSGSVFLVFKVLSGTCYIAVCLACLDLNILYFV